MMEPKRPDARLSARLPDPIADLRPAAKFLRRLEEMRRDSERSERNV